MRIMLREGSDGGSLALADRFFNPLDANGEKKALFRLDIAAGPGGDVRFEPEQWSELELSWDTGARVCEVRLDGLKRASLNLLNETSIGATYLRLRSTAAKIDPAGLLVESVAAQVASGASSE
jgi:hypothetical protein